MEFSRSLFVMLVEIVLRKILTKRLHLLDGFIQTDVYSKPTNRHLYLPPSSAHPKHLFKAIPFGVASRLRRNCSEENSY